MKASRSIEIDRAAGEVFAFVADFQNNPKWQSGQKSCTWTSEPPLRVGSTYVQRARFLGKEMRNSFEVIDVEPARRVKFTSTSGTFPLTITRTVEPLGTKRSRFTEEVEGDPTGFFSIGEPLLRQMVKRSIKRDFSRLKALLER